MTEVPRGAGRAPAGGDGHHMSKAQVKKNVRDQARAHGVTISPKPGDSPLMGKGDWFEVFDTWEDAQAFFRKVWIAKVDLCAPFPWEKGKA